MYRGRRIFDAVAQTVLFIIGTRTPAVPSFRQLSALDSDAQTQFVYQLMYGTTSSV